jgi:hypothetical protein
MGENMDRGIKDEGFVRKALDSAKSIDGRWIANQSSFNFPDDTLLNKLAHASLITATAVYVQNNSLDEEWIEKAINADTCGKARALIDQCSNIINNK